MIADSTKHERGEELLSLESLGPKRGGKDTMTFCIVDAFGDVVCGGFDSAIAAWNSAAVGYGHTVRPEE